jgi:hypothetical protein
LTIEGLNKIVAIKASLNRGLSPQLTSAFPNITPVPRPLVQYQIIYDPYWLAGFVDAEGCFTINIINSQGNKLSHQVRSRFIITQHIRDKY